MHFISQKNIYSDSKRREKELFDIKMFKLCHVQEKLIPFSSIYKIFFKSQKMSKIYNAIDLSIILSRILPNNTRVVYLKKEEERKQPAIVKHHRATRKRNENATLAS